MLKTGITIVLALGLASCAKQETPAASAPHATIQMRDGSRFSGAVVASSATAVKVVGDDNTTRAIPMTQVRSIDYGDALASGAAAAAGAPATPAPPPSSPAAASAPPSAPPPPSPVEAPHESHPHAVQSAVTTKTYRVPAGTEIPVRNEEAIDSAQAVEGQTFAAEVTRDIRD